MDASENREQELADYRGYAAATALQYRLSTQPILDQLELFLKGERIILKEEKGRVKKEKIKLGEKKASDEGVQSIMAYVTAIINSAVVQGNFDSEQYERFIYNKRMELAQDIVTNREPYEIKGENMNLIIDFTMSLIEPFVSRLLDNEERKSYETTLRTIESSKLETAKNFGLFNKSKD